MKSLDSLSQQEKMALSLFKAEVQKICKDKDWEIRVFGSRARMEGDEESDLDVLVLVGKLDNQTKVQIWDAAYAIFSKTDILLSPHVLSKEQYESLKRRERLIAINIEREGISL